MASENQMESSFAARNDGENLIASLLDTKASASTHGSDHDDEHH